VVIVIVSITVGGIHKTSKRVHYGNVREASRETTTQEEREMQKKRWKGTKTFIVLRQRRMRGGKKRNNKESAMGGLRGK